jgi:integrase
VGNGSDPVSRKPTPVTRTVHGTRRQAERALTALLKELDDGAHRGPDATLGKLLDKWWAGAVRTRDWSPATKRGYASYRRTYLGDHEGRRLVDETPEWLDDLYVSLLSQKVKRGKGTLSPATVYKVHVMLHDALGSAVRWGWLVWNPADRAQPPSVKRRPVVLPQRDVLRTAVETVAKKDAGYAAMLHLQAVAGLRRAELLGLRWTDLDEEHLWIRRTVVIDDTETVVVQDDTKSHRARRLVLDAGTLAVLEAHRIRAKDTAAQLEVEPDPDAYLFPRAAHDPMTPQSPDQATRRWARWRSNLGLEGVKLHAFRHAMCTFLLDQGVPVHDVAARAGHANANVTLAIYTHPTTEGARRAGEAAGF